MSLDQASDYEWERLEIQRVQKTTGEDIQFVNASGRILYNCIEGIAIVEEKIERENIHKVTSIYGNQSYTHEMILNNHEQYNLRSYRELDDKIVLVKLDEEVTVPLSEIKEVEFIKKSHGTGAVYGGGIGLLIGIGISIKTHFEAEEGIAIIMKTILIGGSTVIGLLSGAMGGTTNTYILTAPADSTFEKVETEEEIESGKQVEMKKIDTEGGVIASVSDRVGETIDLQERNNYNLFSNIQGFQSAALFKLPDGRYVFEITTLDGTTGEETIEQMIQTESQIEQIRDYIEQFE
ncbi:hypothetical protein JW824_02875 [bacterium]|nr:hypothetical protein [bacterium]